MSSKLSTLLQPLTSRFVYVIGDDGAVLVYIEKNKVVRRLFAASPDAPQIETFKELLQAYPRAPIYALVDVMDQVYARHKLPPVSSLGLNKLVSRRLDRDFGKSDVKGALNLGRDKDGRKDWNFLLISLSITDTLKAWFDIVIELPNYFGGVYLMPVECEYVTNEIAQAFHHAQAATTAQPQPSPIEPNEPSLPEAVEPSTATTPQFVDVEAEKPDAPRKKFSFSPKKDSSATLKAQSTKKASPKKSGASFSFTKKSPSGAPREERGAQWRIMVTHNKVGGFRQVVLHNQKLVFTRQAQGMENAPVELIAGSVEQELQNTIEYLKRLAFNPADGLEVFILIADEIKAHIATQNFGFAQVHVLTPYETAQHLGLKHAVLSSDRFGDIIIATLFGTRWKKRLKLNFPYAKKLETLYKVKWGMRLFTLVSGLSFITLGIFSGISWISANDELTVLQSQKRMRMMNIEEVKKTALSLGVDANTVTDMLAMYKEISAPIESPLSLAQKLSPIITETLQLNRFELRTDNITPGAMPMGGAVASTPEQMLTPYYSVNLGVDVVYQQSDWKEFLNTSELAFDKIIALFPDYEISHTNLPGLFNPNDVIQIQENKESTGPKAGDIFTVSFDIKGPKPKEPPAGAAAPAAIIGGED